jgi:branched-chain amino acid transport system permease protein
MGSLQILIQQIIGGLAIGSMYALVALGCALIFSGMKVVNWAQGEFYMIGAFTALTAYVTWKWPFIFAFLFSVGVMFIVGTIVEKVTIDRVRESDHLTLLMITIGISIFAKQVAILIWSPIGAVFPTIFGDVPFQIWGVYIVPQNIYVMLIGIVLMIILYVFLFRTKMGMAMRAVSQSREIAGIMGVNTKKMDMLTFGIGICLAAAAGIIMAPLTYIEPMMGVTVGIKGFVAAVIGGFGNLFGAVLGGIIIGIIETTSAFFISSGYKDAVVFSILIVVLVFKPQGLLAFSKGKKN